MIYRPALQDGPEDSPSRVLLSKVKQQCSHETLVGEQEILDEIRADVEAIGFFDEKNRASSGVKKNSRKDNKQPNQGVMEKETVNTAGQVGILESERLRVLLFVNGGHMKCCSSYGQADRVSNLSIYYQIMLSPLPYLSPKE